MDRAWIDSLFRQRTDAVLVQLFRYAFVGGIAFLVDFGSLYVLTDRIGLHYLISAALAFLLGLATNYSLSIVWVFNQRRLRSRWLEFAVFGLIGLAGLGMNELVMWTLTGLIGIHYLLSKLVSTAIVYFWNFFARRFALFREATNG